MVHSRALGNERLASRGRRKCLELKDTVSLATDFPLR
jgi:hypothetical protein